MYHGVWKKRSRRMIQECIMYISIQCFVYTSIDGEKKTSVKPYTVLSYIKPEKKWVVLQKLKLRDFVARLFLLIAPRDIEVDDVMRGVRFVILLFSRSSPLGPRSIWMLKSYYVFLLCVILVYFWFFSLWHFSMILCMLIVRFSLIFCGKFCGVPF